MAEGRKSGSVVRESANESIEVKAGWIRLIIHKLFSGKFHLVVLESVLLAGTSNGFLLAATSNGLEDSGS